MNPELKIPPKSKRSLTDPKLLAERLAELVGKKFTLTGKTRTDGSNVRKLVASVLEKHGLPPAAANEDFEIVPTNKKGIPKITREFVDTYIVTSGNYYNLQVWNRIPSAESLLIKYNSDESLKCIDVRFVLVKINTISQSIASVLVLTPNYIVEHFGNFGKPTIKNQLLISRTVRRQIHENSERILFFPDSAKLAKVVQNSYEIPKSKMTDDPDIRHLFSLKLLKDIVAKPLIGFKLNAASTKTRGQALERKVLSLLGYAINEGDLLFGDFPDVRNQLLEVKVQDSPTVDLGKYSPEKEEISIAGTNLTTLDTRYLIALTDPSSEMIIGIIICPGEKLGDMFSYVSAQSYKCQRAIPMNFFENHDGSALFNPE